MKVDLVPLAILMGLATYPWRALPLLAHFLTDEAFALALSHFRRIGRGDLWGYWWGAIVATFIPWNLATLAGVVLGGQIPEPERLGLDVIFPAAMAGLAVGLGHPSVESVTEGLALALNGKVNQRGGAAVGGGDGAGFEVVGADGAAERHVEVGVDVNAAGHDVAARGGEHLAGGFRRQGSGDGGDAAVFDADVGLEGVGGGNDSAALDERVELHRSPPR